MVDARTEFYNDFDEVLFNSEDFNWVMVNKGSSSSWTVASGLWISTVRKLTISFDAGTPALAFACTHLCSIASQSLSGTTWTFIILAPDFITAPTFYWWGFDLAKNVTGDGFGIEMRNAAVEATFKLGQYPMRGIDVLNIADPTLTPGASYTAEVNGSYPSGRTYAVMQNQLFVREQVWLGSGGFPPDDFTTYTYQGAQSMAKVNGTAVQGIIGYLEQDTEYYLPDGTPEETHQDGHCQWTVIDVTGY